MRSSRRDESGLRRQQGAHVDDKVLFERLWKGTFRAIVAASLGGERPPPCAAVAARTSRTLRSVISVKESHQMAEANQEKNLKMREALGISQYFIEGSSLDPTRKAKEAAAAAAQEEAAKRYALIPDSDSSSNERVPEKEKEKKRKKKKSHGSHEKLDSASSAKKKKSSKKQKKHRAY